MPLENQIEAILFYKNEPVSLTRLCSMLKKSEEEIMEGVIKLKNSLETRGLSLIEERNNFMLSTSKQASSLIENLAKEELSKEIGKAGLETLAIILYKGETTRREIDFVRGVNSTFILRSLMSRGLIERNENEKDGRVFTYRPTLDLLAHLGIKKREELPDYESVREQINKLENTINADD